MPGKGLSYVASAANEPSNRGSKNSGLDRAFGKLPTAYTANFLPRSCVLTEHTRVYIGCILRIFSARAYYVCNHACVHT